MTDPYLEQASRVTPGGIIRGKITKQGEMYREMVLDKTEYAPLTFGRRRLREHEGQNDTRIQLGSLEHDIKPAPIKVLPGRMVVEMLPPQHERGLVVLPPNVAGNLRSDIAVVLASGGPVWRKGRLVEAPEAGTTVCVMPYGGTWIDGVDTRGQVRVYGAYKPLDEAFLCDWWECVVCSISETGGEFEMRPYGDKILLRLDPVVKTDGGVILADQSQYRTGKATVVGVGPFEFDCKEGDRVVVDLEMLEQTGLTFDLHKDRDLAICNRVAVCWIEEA